MRETHRRSLACAAFTVAALAWGPAPAADAEAAQSLVRHNNCLKCHSPEKDKAGPAFRKVAAKYRGNPEAEAKLIRHLTSGEAVKFPDGHEEEHKIIKTNPAQDTAQVLNLVQWILSL